MTESQYIRINPDGSAEFVREVREARNFNAEAAKVFAEGTVLISRNVGRVNFGEAILPFHLIANQGERIMVAQLYDINLRCNFQLDSAGALVPNFLSKDSPLKDKYPKTSLRWRSPKTMTLFFACPIRRDEEYNMYHSNNEKPWLIAYNPGRQAWQLPLPNIYDNCEVCMGEFNGRGKTYLDAFGLAISQFLASEWNTDLIGNKADKAESLFRFVPDKSETRQLGLPEDNWTDYCNKVATPITLMIGGLL